MRYATWILLFVMNTAFAQDNILFKVVTYSDGVTINDEPVKVGMYVNNPGYQVNIPSGGYLGVITRSGDVIKIKSSTVTSNIKGAGDEAVDMTGRCTLGLTLFGLPEDNQAPIMGDSLFLNWHADEPIVENYATMQIRNIDEESVAELKTTSNSYTVTSIGNIWKDETVLLMQIKGHIKGSKYLRTDPFVLKKPTKRQLDQLQFDLKRLEGSKDLMLLRSAVFLLDQFPYDSNWAFYKVIKNKQTTTDPLLSAYYRSTIKRNCLENIRLK